MRRVLALGTLFGLLVLIAHEGTAQTGKKGGSDKSSDGQITNWGQPKAFAGAKTNINAYWIWYDDGVWHFRTTGGGKGAHQFQGKIEVVGGELVSLTGKKGEYKGKLGDRAIFTKKAIAFDFKTDEGVDGLNFAVNEAATELKFTLAFDGEASPKHIRIGHDSDHPSGAVFTVPAHPPEPAPEGKGKKAKGKPKN